MPGDPEYAFFSWQTGLVICLVFVVSFILGLLVGAAL